MDDDDDDDDYGGDGGVLQTHCAIRGHAYVHLALVCFLFFSTFSLSEHRSVLDKKQRAREEKQCTGSLCVEFLYVS